MDTDGNVLHQTDASSLAHLADAISASGVPDAIGEASEAAVEALGAVLEFIAGALSGF